MALVDKAARARWVRAVVIGELVLVLGLGAPYARGAPVGPATPSQVGMSPYDRMPADSFAEGEAGIVLPPAEAVPERYLADYKLNTRAITAEDVADALESVRRALVATRLDNRMLVGHDPEPLIRTLSRSYWYAWFDPYLPELRELDLYELPEFGYLATKLASDTQLAAEPRVAGRITFGAGTSGRGRPANDEDPWHVLRIATKFVWVYALKRPGKPVGIAVIRNEVVWHVPTDYRLDWSQQNLGLHYTVAEVRAWGVDCDLYEKDGLVQPNSGDIPEAAFDVDEPLERTDGCQPSRDCSRPVVAASCAVLGE